VSCSLHGGFCCSDQCEGAQVWRGLPPWSLLSDTWFVRSNVMVLVACRCSVVFLQFSYVLTVADPTAR
jgi:low affinity Fe/Cu permease